MNRNDLIWRLGILLVAGFWFWGCQGGGVTADLVLVNGKIATVDAENSIQEAVAIAGNRIAAVGSNRRVKRLISQNTRVIDLEGKLVIPGIIDSHGHFLSMGRALLTLDLSDARSWQEVVRKVQGEVNRRPAGQLVRGRGWHQEKWERPPVGAVEGLPVHTALSRISPDHPVILTHASGHSCIANRKAMELAGIDSTTPDPDGGEIVRDSTGTPIGVFRENAMGLLSVAAAYQEGKEEDRRDEIFMAAQRECLRQGVTGFHDAGVSFQIIDYYRQLLREGKLKIRINAMINESNPELENRLADFRVRSDETGHFLVVRCVKRLIDGALGSHGAWLLEPYQSLPDSRGLNTEPLDKMEETARIAIREGFQLATHAIGDRGVRETLNIYEETFKKYPQPDAVRWRIEHAQHIHPEDIPRFGRLGIIASMQGIHCTSDGPWVFKRLGEQRAREGAYVWRKLLDSGAVICNGTDVPVEKVDPMPGFQALITRKMKDGQSFFPDQVMTREEALRAYTINGAFASFEEDIKGSIEKGKLADMVILSRDLLTVAPEEIRGIEVLVTIIDGIVVFERP